MGINSDQLFDSRSRLGESGVRPEGRESIDRSSQALALQICEDMLYRLKLFLFVLIILALPWLALADGWQQLGSGQHSLRELGENFYVDVPVRPITDAQVRLTFVNRSLAEQMGLSLPKDPGQVEAMLKKLFAYEVDPTGQSTKKWLASYYLDSKEKGPGNAMGDGRALWSGELVMPNADGTVRYIDAVIKGVGRTPLAWLKNKYHNDGKQSLEEKVYSGVQSIAARANQLDATSDLIGFAIYRDGEWTSQTVRIGRQTRPAHQAFHDDKPADEKKMMDYIIKRDLGLSLKAVVTEKLLDRWLAKFTINNADETARLFDLVALHASPTKGNKTTTGGSIDLAAITYLDAYHMEFRYLFNKMNLAEQLGVQRRYVTRVIGFLAKAEYPELGARRDELIAKYDLLFRQRYLTTLTTLSLMRLGLSEKEARWLQSNHRELARSMMTSYRKIQEATSEGTVKPIEPGNTNDGGIKPAAFDIRKVAAGTMAAIQDPLLQKTLFHVSRGWGAPTPTVDLLAPEAQAEYLARAQEVANAFGGVKPEWIERAAKLHANVRSDASTREFWERHETRIVEMIKQNASWIEITQAMEAGAESLTDHGLLKRRSLLAPTVVNSCQAFLAR